jgi:hypothetical protein
MRISESIGSDLKKAYSEELGKTNVISQGGLDAVIAANQFKNEIPENNKKLKIIKKPMKKGVTDKLVNKTNINKPVGKLTSGLPIMGEDKSAKKQFSKDIQTDPDFKKFKQKDNIYGVPNVTISDPFIKKNRYKRVGKEETKEQGASSAGSYSGPLFSETKKQMEEDCWKGYEEKGMKKKGDKMVPNCVKEGKEKEKEKKYLDIEDIIPELRKQLNKGTRLDKDTKKVEATEATDSGSSGSYETTSAWAKSTNKKDWGGKKKTQIPGGEFVQVKKKCQKFPYCNQGDIKALKIFENEKVKMAIQNISKKHNISENVIKTIIAYEYENTFSK